MYRYTEIPSTVQANPNHFTCQMTAQSSCIAEGAGEMTVWRPNESGLQPHTWPCLLCCHHHLPGDQASVCVGGGEVEDVLMSGVSHACSV